ncbi:type IV pilus modification PilV family protein [Candidatus Enterococcus willemsii]|uniref:Type II secretion system protein n=1 Tax=Candidatus Enterococcus willemsii TaxID=1857215 RepID=A0ABQ6YW54_9ENTE|nr:hypothetical protein [Enterococcus sp. CU12B]KAF1301924.1 hypothetical protein BAU17_00720 [Enterococcus sp. CU12B]
MIYRGYILLEAMVAIGLLSIGIVLFQNTQMYLLRLSQNQQQQVAMMRVLYEEIRVNRAAVEIEREGMSIQIQATPYHQASVTKGDTWRIYREN